MRASVRVAIALCLVAFATVSGAQAITWPSASPPCNGSLQACLDAQPAGAEIRIDSDTPGNIGAPGSSVLRMTRGQTLTAAANRRPTFPDGFSIALELAGATPAPTYAVSGLRLRNGGGVFATTHNASGTVRLRVNRMNFLHTSAGARGVQVDQSLALPIDLVVEDNDFIATVPGPFVEVEARAATLSGRVSFNRVFSNADADVGIRIATADSGRLFPLVVLSNRIIANFGTGAVRMRHGAAAGTTRSLMSVSSNLLQPARRGSGRGIAIEIGPADLSAQVFGNTLLELGRGIDITAFDRPSAASGEIDVRVLGNLVAWNGTGVAVQSPPPTVFEGRNLYFGNGTEAIGITPGVGTVRADPRLVSRRNRPWPRPDSPAIDAGAGFSQLDADGQRRAIGSAQDIGAFETGDAWFTVVADSGNVSGNQLLIDHPSTNGNPTAQVYATPNRALGGTSNNGPFGVRWNASAGRMALFNPSGASIPLGAGYNVYVAGPNGDEAVTLPLQAPVAYVHRVQTASATTGLSEGFLGRPDLVLLVTQNWNPQEPPASTGVGNPNRITLRYTSDLWQVANIGGASIPEGAAFNVLALPPSPYAFQIPVGGLSDTAPIRHPLLDGFPCAVIQVTSMNDNAPHELEYAGVAGAGVWRVRRTAVTPWPSTARFHVIFSPRQVIDCAGSEVFTDGFE